LRVLGEETGRDPVVAVAGCVAQQEGQSLLRRSSMVDVVVGTRRTRMLPLLIEESQAAQRPRIDLGAHDNVAFPFGLTRRDDPVRAWITIIEGCNEYCSFCVVPYTRGEEVSRPFDDVLAEVAGLAAQGVKEVTLLGQNVNAYRGKSGGAGELADFATLIEYVAEIPGIERIRYTTSHPTDMTDELIAAHGEVGKLMPYLHLPVQSGSNRILKAMNRSHTVETYLAIIERMRATRPDIAVSGDFIVGFPGETEEDFEATLSIVDEVRYASAYSFKYSPRPGTPAAVMEDQIPRKIMDDRLQRLQARINEHQLAFNRSKVGIDTQVLIERTGRQDGQMVGRSPWLQSVHVETGARAGEIVDVTLVAAGPNSMSGAERQKVAA